MIKRFEKSSDVEKTAMVQFKRNFLEFPEFFLEETKNTLQPLFVLEKYFYSVKLLFFFFWLKHIFVQLFILLSRYQTNFIQHFYAL